MATTTDIYNALMNPWLFYNPVEQNFRTPGFSQATFWDDPAALRGNPDIRADPTATPPPPPPQSAAAALRGVFPSRATDNGGGSPNGGDAQAGIDPMGGQTVDRNAAAVNAGAATAGIQGYNTPGGTVSGAWDRVTSPTAQDVIGAIIGSGVPEPWGSALGQFGQN